MTRAPSSLSTDDFAAWPPQARIVAERHIEVLRQIPLPLLPVLLRELMTYDWKFPIERSRLDDQMAWLQHLDAQGRAAVFEPFAALRLPKTLNGIPWITDPADYMEHLTASLWSTGEMPQFREAAASYADALRTAVPDLKPVQPRLVMIVLDGSLRDRIGRSATFQTLSPHGVLLTQVDPASGTEMLLEELRSRAQAGSDALSHWYLDGGTAIATPPVVTTSSYAALEPVRQQLLQRARNVMNAQRSGPEELRSLMAKMKPEDVGLVAGSDPVLAHFQLSLLTEGSGTQIFSTTFVQWAARECLRRAEPKTLLAFFRARQRQQDMNELLSGHPATGLDPAGSLIDAEQGALYTYLNLLRLPGAEQARFIAWQQGSSQAFLAGPGLPRGATSTSPVTLKGAMALFT